MSKKTIIKKRVRRPIAIRRRFIRQPEDNVDKMGRIKKGRKLNRAEKKLLAVRWRKIGKSYYWIAQQLGCVPSTAYQWCRQALEEINNKTMEEVKHLRVLELQRLDRMLEKLDPGIRVGDTHSVTAALKIMERRARYVGLLEVGTGSAGDLGTPDDLAKKVRIAADVLFKSVPLADGSDYVETNPDDE